jgi:hypothetical protein
MGRRDVTRDEDAVHIGICDAGQYSADLRRA